MTLLSRSYMAELKEYEDWSFRTVSTFPSQKSDDYSQCKRNARRKPRKAATPVQNTNKLLTMSSPCRKTYEKEDNIHKGIVHRPISALSCTRKYGDSSTRIQRRSQSRKRDKLLTMWKGYHPKEKVCFTQMRDMRC